MSIELDYLSSTILLGGVCRTSVVALTIIIAIIVVPFIVIR